jgi:hypothetical protein
MEFNVPVAASVTALMVSRVIPLANISSSFTVPLGFRIMTWGTDRMTSEGLH